MNIKIYVFNCLTNETIIDSVIEVNGNDMEIAKANHKAMSEMNPDCIVNFVIDKDNFIFGMPVNQRKDDIAYQAGRMTWDEYCDKWHSGKVEYDLKTIYQ